MEYINVSKMDEQVNYDRVTDRYKTGVTLYLVYSKPYIEDQSFRSLNKI
jgi:hypothetical protein